MPPNASACLAALLVVGTMPWISGARAQSSPPAADSDLVLAILYQTNDPAGTFRYKVYDARKGQYDAARMTRWARETANRPGTRAYLRGVRLADEPGRTEAEKLAGVIERERTRAAPAPAPAPAPAGRPGPAPSRPGPGAIVPLTGTRWGFSSEGPVVYEFLPGGKLRHFTTTREASGAWEQQGERFSLWIGPSREGAAFTFRGRARGESLAGLVRSRLFPDAKEAAIRALFTPDTDVSLVRIRGDR